MKTGGERTVTTIRAIFSDLKELEANLRLLRNQTLTDGVDSMSALVQDILSSATDALKREKRWGDSPDFERLMDDVGMVVDGLQGIVSERLLDGGPLRAAKEMLDFATGIAGNLDVLAGAALAVS